MPSEIKVSPPGLTISQGRTFMVTGQRGEIEPFTDGGIFSIDTRFVSTYRVFVNREPWQLVNSGQISFYAARIHLTNPPIHTVEADIPANTLSLTIERTVGEGIHEDFDLTNYSGKPILVVLELELHSDFADIFEVRTKRLVQRGKLRTVWNEERRELRTAYTDQDFHRAVVYRLQNCEETPVGYANGKLFLDVQLAGSGMAHLRRYRAGAWPVRQGVRLRSPTSVTALLVDWRHGPVARGAGQRLRRAAGPMAGALHRGADAE